MREPYQTEEVRSQPQYLSPPPVSPSPTSLPFKEHIKRGWDWVIFVWQMLQRLGGPLDILRTFGTIFSILMTRLLVQLGLKKRR
jgi:hypothetical protein